METNNSSGGESLLKKIEKAIECLENLSDKQVYNCFTGFDGFVDTLVRPVWGYKDGGQCEFFSTIAEFGKYIQGKAGKSCCIELKRDTVKSGGNAFLYANAMAGMGISTNCVGAFGYPDANSVFRDTNEALNLISIAPPGNCLALEFSDGKVMLGDNAGIDAMDYRVLKEKVGEKDLLSMLEGADMVSFMNWSELRGCSDIWKGFLSEIFPGLRNGQKKQMFIDLSDCSGRDAADIMEMLGMISEFGRYFEVSLSLNANEFAVISNVLSGWDKLTQEAFEEEAGSEEWLKKAGSLYDFCGLKNLFIHLREGAYGLDGQQVYFTETRLVKNPKCSTGGGDNFNAGLSYALLNQLDMESAMIIGNAASGYYITQGESADKEGLLQYLDNWRLSLIAK